MTEFVDSTARARITEPGDENLFVEAGAGTGKTSAMVARIVNLIASGAATIGSITAITFTEAAAGELRERVRVALEARCVGDQPLQNPRCLDALANLESAAIQTIHGFAHRILLRFAVDARVPPSFSVQDRVQANLLAAERWNVYLQRVLGTMTDLGENEREVIRVATALGLSQRHLKGLMLAIDKRWHSARGLVAPPAGSAPSVDVRKLLKMVDDVYAGFNSCMDESDTFCEWRRTSFDPWVHQLRVASSDADPLAMLEALGRAPSLKVGNKGNKGKWASGTVEAQRQLVTAIADERSALLEGPRQWALHGVVSMLARYVVGEAQRRLSRGELDFHDLLVYAFELVQVPRVAEALRTNYRYVFVDEFQDTDALQVRLINALTGGAGGGEAARLFTVGDPKQSIYRFRGADLTQFHAVRDSGKAEVQRLVTNFRSVASVVHWVNNAFEPVLASSMKEWVDLDAARAAISSNVGGVQVIGEALVDARARDVRETEAQEVVSVLRLAKREGWLIESAAGSRPVRFGDMAVLMPTRRSLPALERELRRAQVPYRVESRSLIWATQEIRDLRAVLKAVADPRQEIAVVAALRSAAFGCGDDDLYAWRTTGHGWNYMAELDEAAMTTPVGASMCRLKALHQRHHWVSVSQFVSEVVAQLRMYELAFARSTQREAWHRLRFAVDRARAWTEDGGSGLYGFVDWMDTQDRESADAVETVVPEADDDAVRLMTIHASKGLEFPFVALVGLGSRDSVTDSARLLWRDDDGVEVRIGDKDSGWETPGFKEAAEREAQHEEDEQARLLYVAATRARDHLLVSLYRQLRGRPSPAARLAEVVECPAVVEVAQAAPGVEARVTIEQGESVADRRLRRANVVRKAARSLSLSATAIALKSAGAEGVLPSLAAGSGDLDANELAERLAFGSAVHSGLETIDLDAEDDAVTRVAGIKAAEYAIAHRTADVARSIRNALGSHHVRRALTSGKWWREVPVYGTAAPGAEMVVGGTIDLLYEIDGEFVVVDYKTEEVKDVDASRRALERYKWQLVTYALVCSRTTGKTVREAALLFIPPSDDRATTVDVEPLDELMEQLPAEVLPLLR